MGAPVVLAMGVGQSGAWMVGWSARRHLRHMRYVIADTDNDALDRSSVPHRIHLELGGAGVIASDAAVARALADVDLCVVACGLGGATGSGGAIRIARQARLAGVKCACIGIVPPSHEAPVRRRRAETAIDELAAACDILFLEQLEPLLGEGAPNEPRTRLDDLYGYVDRIIELACAPAPVNLLIRAASKRGRSRARLGLYRRLLLAPNSADPMESIAADLADDPSILENQFAEATDATTVVLGGQRPSAALLAQVATGLARVLPHTAELDLMGRVNPTLKQQTGIELVSFCPCPARLGTLTMSAAPRRWRPLMPWLDAGPRTPIHAASPNATGHEYDPVGSWHDRSDPYRERRSPVIGFLRQQFSREGRFRKGGVVAWLDEILTRVEVAPGRIAGHAGSQLAALRSGRTTIRGALSQSATLARDNVLALRSTTAWNWRSLAVLGTLVLLPALLAHVVLANRRSVDRALQTVNAEQISVVHAFRESDKFRIKVASKASPSTYGVYETLGLAAALPSAQSSHLDLWAVDQDYLNLHGFAGPVPPFAFVESDRSRKKSQLAVVVKALSEGTFPAADALVALGFTNLDAASLADVTDGSQPLAATQLYGIHEPAGPGGSLKTVFDLAGCRTLRLALNDHFAWKRMAVSDVQLTDRHYLVDLAVPSIERCRGGTQSALAAAAVFERFKEIAYVREESSGDGPVLYSVVIPRELAAEPAGQDELGLYLAGLRAFYLLDFDRARNRFEFLSRSLRPNAATLGAFLVARTIFWQHDFQKGSYRPDLFPPWRYLITDRDLSRTDRDLGDNVNAKARALKEKHELSSCGDGGSASSCLWSSLRQPASELKTTIPTGDGQRLEVVLHQVERNPIISPALVRGYIAPAPAADVGVEEEGPEP